MCTMVLPILIILKVMFYAEMSKHHCHLRDVFRISFEGEQVFEYFRGGGGLCHMQDPNGTPTPHYIEARWSGATSSIIRSQTQDNISSQNS